MTRLSLRFENMPERHAELAWRFGEPDECEVADEEVPGGGSWWTLRSPMPPEASVTEHLTWASECLHPHEAFARELVSLGGKIVLQMECSATTASLFFQINARLLLPMAHAGVLIEFHADLTDSESPS